MHEWTCNDFRLEENPHPNMFGTGPEKGLFTHLASDVSISMHISTIYDTMINDINRESKHDLMSQTFIINCISTFSCRYHFGLWSQTYGFLDQLCQGNQSNIYIIVTRIKIKVTTKLFFICCIKKWVPNVKPVSTFSTLIMFKAMNAVVKFGWPQCLWV